MCLGIFFRKSPKAAGRQSVKVGVVRPPSVFDTAIYMVKTQSAHYLQSMEKASDALQIVKTDETMIILQEFNAHIGKV